MRKFTRAALLGAALSLGITNAGQAKTMIKKTVKIERWTCPAGTLPDDKNRAPNCDRQDPAALSAAQSGAPSSAQPAAPPEGEQAQLGEEEKGEGECPVAEKVMLEKRVDFGPAHTEIGETTKATLDEVAQTATNDSDIKKIRIEGHADNTGTPKQNETLAESRAEATRNYLVEQGVPEELIETESFSDSSPVASNDSADGRALNRSALVEVLK